MLTQQIKITRKALATPSRSIRFAASAAKFSISRCLSWPEKQFYQINRVFHIFWIRDQFLKLLVVRIEFLELFSCWGMAPNRSDICFTRKSIFHERGAVVDDLVWLSAPSRCTCRRCRLHQIEAFGMYFRSINRFFFSPGQALRTDAHKARNLAPAVNHQPGFRREDS